MLRKPVVLMRTCKPHTGEVEARRSDVQSHVGDLVCSKASLMYIRLCLKSQTDRFSDGVLAWDVGARFNSLAP